MIQVDESITHPALINTSYIKAYEYDPTKNTPVVIESQLGGKRKNKKKNKRTKKQKNKKKNKRTKNQKYYSTKKK
jgi:hypothetical protein